MWNSSRSKILFLAEKHEQILSRHDIYENKGNLLNVQLSGMECKTIFLNNDLCNIPGFKIAYIKITGYIVKV